MRAKKLGDRFPGESAGPDLYTGITLATLSLFGKIPNEMHLFIVLASGKATISAAVFKKMGVCHHSH